MKKKHTEQKFGESKVSDECRLLNHDDKWNIFPNNPRNLKFNGVNFKDVWKKHNYRDSTKTKPGKEAHMNLKEEDSENG